MTDKQIIIDDIDVKQCKYFNSYQKIVRNNKCIVDMQNACIEEIKTKPCSQKHNCYFKNWQRKEQECEQQKAELELFKTSNQTTIDQLKAENDALFKAIEEVNKINKRLESENEELTLKCSQLKLENIKQGNKILALKSKRLNMFEHLDIVQKNIEYEEFLKDLKATAERARKHLFATKSEDYSDGMKWLGCLLWNRIEELEEKLQKINKVEDVNNNR